jgi:hypothetical protein
MGYVIVLLLVAVGVTVYALVDCWNSSGDEVRGLPRPAWLLIGLLLPLVGSIAYLIYGREWSTLSRLSRRRVVAPDDDLEFLRQLDLQHGKLLTGEDHLDQQQREHKECEHHEYQERKQPKESKEPQGDHNGEGHTGHSTNS